MNDFERRCQLWLEGAQKIIDDHDKVHFPNLFFGSEKRELAIARGRRYIRVFEHRPKTTGFNQRTVFAFIDTTNGDVLKAATWKAPAKTARGNVFNPDDGLDCVNSCGIKYLR